MFTDENFAKEGYSLLAGALLAIEHFNNRDTSIVPELANVSDCDIYFPEDRLIFVDSFRSPDQALKPLIFEDEDPCAIVGPENSEAAKIVGSTSSVLDIPSITYGAMNEAITDPAVFPRITRGTASMQTYARPLIQYLKTREYVALLRGTSDFDGTFAEAFGDQASQALLGSQIVRIDTDHDDIQQEIVESLMQILQSGYRTIVVAMTRDDLLELVATEAEQLGMLHDQFLWIFLDEAMQPEFVGSLDVAQTDPRHKLFKGSLIYGILEGFEWNTEDRFLPAWESLNSTFVDYVNIQYAAMVRTSYVVYQADADYFQSTIPAHQTTFVYDSVIASVVSFCNVAGNLSALELLNQTSFGAFNLGDLEIQELSSIEFTGASGQFRLNDEKSRALEDLSFGLYNLLPTGESSFEATLASHYNGTSMEWISLQDFVYSDGTTNEPTPTRYISDKNYLSPPIRTTGLVVMSIAMCLVSFCAVFTVVYRKERIMTASQPEFLYLLFFGAMTLLSSTIVLSFDESYGWTVEQLTRSCKSRPWLFFSGYLIIYLALFSKLWRVRRVLQMRRQQIKWGHVLGPFAFFMVSEIVILIVWQVTSPLEWRREVTAEAPPQSSGGCHSDHSLPFICILGALAALATAITAWMAYKAYDIPGEFSDAEQVRYTIYLHIQSIVIGLPTAIILVDTSPNVFFLGASLIITLIAATSVSLIMAPKINKILKKKFSRDPNPDTTRGTVHISGFTDPRTVSKKYNNPFRRSNRESQGADTLVTSTANSQRNHGSLGGSTLSHSMFSRITSFVTRTTTTSSGEPQTSSGVPMHTMTSTGGVSLMSQTPIIEESATSDIEKVDLAGSIPDQITGIEIKIRLLEEEKDKLLSSKSPDEEGIGNA